MATFQRISPCLWFDHEAEEAANFYIAIFPNSRVIGISRYTSVGKEFHGKPEGSVMAVRFSLDGQEFTALNGGPHYKFNEAISLQIFCKTQEEVDHYRSSLIADGGKQGQGGWLTDKYGLSWQVVRATA